MNRGDTPSLEGMTGRADGSPARSRGPRAGQRLLALLLVSAFAGVQYHWWLDGRRYRAFWEPTPVLGPLYFLSNERTEDDWQGIVLLVMSVPCISAFPVRPNRRTALLASLAILAWVGPGILLILHNAP